MGRAAPDADAGDGPAFLAVATPFAYALAAQAWHGLSGCFSVSAILGALHQSCLRPRRALVFISALVPAAAAALVVLIGPWPSPGSATGGWAGWRKAAQSFPVGPVLPVWFLLVLLFFSAAATKLAG